MRNKRVCLSPSICSVRGCAALSGSQPATEATCWLTVWNCPTATVQHNCNLTESSTNGEQFQHGVHRNRKENVADIRFTSKTIVKLHTFCEVSWDGIKLNWEVVTNVNLFVVGDIRNPFRSDRSVFSQVKSSHGKLQVWAEHGWLWATRRAARKETDFSEKLSVHFYHNMRTNANELLAKLIWPETQEVF